MRGARENEICQGKLVNVPESLEKLRIDHLQLTGRYGDCRVNWVAKLMNLSHAAHQPKMPMPPTF